MDSLVLGCTHYVFAREQLRTLLGPDIQFIDTGAPVARQTRRVLDRLASLASESGTLPVPEGQVRLMTTGSLQALQAAASRWLDLPAQCCSAVQVGESSTAPAAA
jgi:glutamate racemase